MTNNGEIFIVWGRNSNLATQVEKELSERGYFVAIGGSEENPRNIDFYLGAQLRKQMDRASSAIILVQWPYEGTTLKNKKHIEFRANLMFEWGYLSNRIHPTKLFVFLIGIDKSQLPTDLLGSWAYEVPYDAIDIAKFVAQKYTENEKQRIIRPEDAYNDWVSWKKNIQDQIEGHSALEIEILAFALVHSIQPAYYFDDLSSLEKLINRISADGIKQKNLQLAKQAVIGALLYYKLTPDSGAKPTRGELIELESLLKDFSRVSNENDTTRRWIYIAALDFLGLCHRRLSEAEGIKNPLTELLIAENTLTKGLQLLDLFGEKEHDHVWLLWRGYLTRNLGRVLFSLNKIEEAKAMLLLAKTIRERTFAKIFPGEFDKKVKDALMLEVILADVDLMKMDCIPIDFEKTIAMLERYKPTSTFNIWNKTFTQAIGAARLLNEENSIKELERINPLKESLKS